MAAEHLFAGIPVADRDASLVQWYERLARAPARPRSPTTDEAAWRLTDSGWICLVRRRRAARARRRTRCWSVTSIGFLAEVAERGILPGPVETIAASVRQSVITDPDGNRLKVGASPGPEAPAVPGHASAARSR